MTSAVTDALSSARIEAGVVLAAVPGVDLVAILPVVVPVAGLLLVLLVDAAAPGSARRAARLGVDAVALASLLGAAAAVAWLASGPERATACVTGSAGLLPQCSFVVSDLTLALQAVTLAGAAGCLLLALDQPMLRTGASTRVPHHVLLLAATAGALALAGARDLATLVVALETATVPAIALVALRRDARGAQAGLTMLLTAVGALGLLVLGVGLLVLATGSLHLETIATVLSTPGLAPPVTAVAGLGVLLALAGLGFKLSLVPFHLWTPDTYAGAPLPVAAFLATVSKTAGVAAAGILLGLAAAPLSRAWAPVVGGLAVVTMTVGNLVALRQQVAVRLLAWSTVAQAGWVVLPLAAVAGGPAAVGTALQASIGYLLAYVVATLAVFAVVLLLARHHPAGEEHTLADYRGLVRTEPVAGAVLVFALTCLAGLPPGVMGLVAKLLALRPLVDRGGWLLAVPAALNVALGLAYYLRWAGLVVRTPTGAAAPPRWRVRPAEGVALGAAAAGCLALSVGGQVLFQLVPGIIR